MKLKTLQWTTLYNLERDSIWEQWNYFSTVIGLLLDECFSLRKAEQTKSR